MRAWQHQTVSVGPLCGFERAERAKRFTNNLVCGLEAETGPATGKHAFVARLHRQAFTDGRGYVWTAVRI